MKTRVCGRGKMGVRGFSLIEILISLVILSVSLLAIASLMAMTTRNNASGAQMTEAINLAQDKIEELSVTPSGNLLPGTDQKKGATGVNYSRNWTILPNATGNLRALSVTVNWNNRENHSINLLSRYANEGWRTGLMMKIRSVFNNRGLTLIELLIVFVICGIIVAGIYRVFVAQSKACFVQDQVVEVQQNIRVATEVLMKNLRMAGYDSNSVNSKIKIAVPITAGDHSVTVNYEYAIRPNTR